MYVKWNSDDPQMKYEVKGETETHYDLAISGLNPKSLYVECDPDEDLPDIVDVYCWLVNNGKIK